MAEKKKAKKKRKRAYHTGTYVSAKTGEQCKYRSGWELSYMQYLDVVPEVSTWHYEPFFIEYVSNKKTGRIRKYYPDFYVTFTDGRLMLVEIKQKRRLDNASVKRKATAARGWCEEHGATYSILTEIELKGLGLL